MADMIRRSLTTLPRRSNLRKIKLCLTWCSVCSCAAGGVLADQVWNWHRFTRHFWTLLAVAVVGAIYILLGFLPYVDNFGHLFGMGAGFFLTTCLLRSFQARAVFLVWPQHLQPAVEMLCRVLTCKRSDFSYSTLWTSP